MQKLAYLAAAILVLPGITAGAFHLTAQAISPADDKDAIQDLYNQFNDCLLYTSPSPRDS